VDTSYLLHQLKVSGNRHDDNVPGVIADDRVRARGHFEVALHYCDGRYGQLRRDPDSSGIVASLSQALLHSLNGAVIFLGYLRPAAAPNTQFDDIWDVIGVY
jgi:hypothetical protein